MHPKNSRSFFFGIRYQKYFVRRRQKERMDGFTNPLANGDAVRCSSSQTEGGKRAPPEGEEWGNTRDHEGGGALGENARDLNPKISCFPAQRRFFFHRILERIRSGNRKLQIPSQSGGEFDGEKTNEDESDKWIQTLRRGRGNGGGG